MKYRATQVLAIKSYAADFTELIDINIADPISMLNIQFQALNAAVDTIDAIGHWAQGLTKIELVDGSEVLFSLNGMEIFGIQFPLFKNYIDNWLHYMGSNYYVINLRIPFGRKLWDPDFALVPANFKNLQLRIQGDMNGGGVLPTACKLAVEAHCFDTKTISPVGFLQTKEIKDYTVAASGHEYTELPTDLKIRKLFVKALLAGTEPNAFINHLKLSEDGDKHVPFDLDTDELCQIFPDDNMLIEDHYRARAHNTQTHNFCTPTSKVGMLATPIGDTGSSVVYVNEGDGGRVHIIGSGSVYADVYVRGFYPNGILTIPMGNEDDPEDWFDPELLKNLRLDLTAGSGAGTTNTAQIILQQLHPY